MIFRNAEKHLSMQFSKDAQQLNRGGQKGEFISGYGWWLPTNYWSSASYTTGTYFERNQLRVNSVLCTVDLYSDGSREGSSWEPSPLDLPQFTRWNKLDRSDFFRLYVANHFTLPKISACMRYNCEYRQPVNNSILDWLIAVRSLRAGVQPTLDPSA